MRRRGTLLWFVTASLMLLPLIATERVETGGTANIGSRLELLVDDVLIDSMKGVARRLHSPRSAGTVLTFDKPWEGNTSWGESVFKDGQIYRMYYMGRSDPDYARTSGLEPGEKVVPKHPGFLCYAESRDGITWTRPSLGLQEFNGSKDNNIVAPDVASLVPFLDTNPACPPSERYKMSGLRERAGDGAWSVSLMVSGDGVHWRRLQDKPILTRSGSAAFDGLGNAFWSEHEGCYVLYYRPGSTPGRRARSLARSTSPNFREWSDQTLMDFGNTPLEHLYTNSVVPYFRAPHIYLGFSKRFMPWRQHRLHEDAPWPGLSEAVFMTSRDGIHWNRFMEAFIRPGRDERNWVHRTTHVSVGALQTAADEISLYVLRHYTYPSVHMERFVLRTDGFVSVSADYKGGELITKPFIFQGDTLVLNYETSAAGSVRVEIQDPEGRPLPGFSLEESPEIWGDEIAGTVKWKRNVTRMSPSDPEPFARLAGSPVRLRFVMKDADLYSFRFR